MALIVSLSEAAAEAKGLRLDTAQMLRAASIVTLSEAAAEAKGLRLDTAQMLALRVLSP